MGLLLTGDRGDDRTSPGDDRSVRPGAGTAPRGGRRGRRLGFVLLALLVLRAVETAAVAVAAGLVAGASAAGVAGAAPRLELHGPARLVLAPETPGTQLAVLVVGAAAAVVLLRTGWALAHLAGISGLITAATAAVAAATGPGPLPARLGVLAAGVAATALIWPRLRRVLPALMARAGMHRLAGPAGELALAVKILVVVALVSWVA